MRLILRHPACAMHHNACGGREKHAVGIALVAGIFRGKMRFSDSIWRGGSGMLKLSAYGWSSALVLLGIASCGAAVSRASERARPSDGFVDSMGINIHASFPGTSYDNWDGVI